MIKCSREFLSNASNRLFESMLPSVPTERSEIHCVASKNTAYSGVVDFSFHPAGSLFSIFWSFCRVLICLSLSYMKTHISEGRADKPHTFTAHTDQRRLRLYEICMLILFLWSTGSASHYTTEPPSPAHFTFSPPPKCISLFFSFFFEYIWHMTLAPESFYHVNQCIDNVVTHLICTVMQWTINKSCSIVTSFSSLSFPTLKII